MFQASFRYSRGKTYFSIDNFSTVSENEKNIRLDPDILLGTLSKLPSPCPARHFVYNFFLFLTEVIFLKFFQSLSEQKTFRPSGPKFWLFSKIAFYLSIKIFVNKLFFWKIFMNFYLFWTLKEKSAYCRFFWLFWQLCIFLVTLGTVLEKLLVFERNCFWIKLRQWVKHFWPCGIFVLAWLSKVHSTGSWECFEEIQFLQLTFFKRFPALCRNVLPSSSISSAKLSKLHSTCPLELLNKFYLLIFFFNLLAHW